MSEQSDIKTLIPTEEIASVGKEQVVVRPIRMGQLTQIIALVTPILSVIKKVAPKATDEESLKNAAITVLMSNPSEVESFLAICLQKEVSWVQDRELDEMVSLVVRVVEVNLDFFIQRLLPCVLQEMGRVKGAVEQSKSLSAGPTPSNG